MNHPSKNEMPLLQQAFQQNETAWPRLVCPASMFPTSLLRHLSEFVAAFQVRSVGTTGHTPRPL